MFTPPIFLIPYHPQPACHPHPHSLHPIPQQTLSPSPSSDPSATSDWSSTPHPQPHSPRHTSASAANNANQPRLPQDADYA